MSGRTLVVTRREIERLLDELVVRVPAAIHAAGLKPNACILASRLGSEWLRARGVRCRPLAVKLSVYNPPAADALEAGTIGEEREPGWGGRVVQLGYGSDQPDTPTFKGWDGHLVLVVEERYLLDLTAVQVRRLEGEKGRAGIKAEPFWVEAREVCRNENVVLRGDDGSLWVYEPKPDDRSFLKAAAWSGYRVRVRGGAVVSERAAAVPGGFVAPEVRVSMGAPQGRRLERRLRGRLV